MLRFHIVGGKLMKYEYGAFVTGETGSTRRAITSANLPTAIPTEIGLGSNTYFLAKFRRLTTWVTIGKQTGS